MNIAEERPWLVLAAGSQLVLYLGFPDLFALTEEHRQALQGLIVIHVATLLGLGALWVARK